MLEKVDDYFFEGHGNKESSWTIRKGFLANGLLRLIRRSHFESFGECNVRLSRKLFHTYHPCFTEPQNGNDELVWESRESEPVPSVLTNRKPLNFIGSVYVVGSVIKGKWGTQTQLSFGTYVPSAKVKGDMTFRGMATKKISDNHSCWRYCPILLSVKGFSRAVSFRKLSR